MEPVLVSSSALRSGERWVAAWSFGAHTLALAASPPPPAAVTNAASQITATGATLNGSVVAAHATTTISFEYGPTPAFGSTVAAIPGTATGSAPTAANALITGLSPGVTYHFRVVASNPHGLTYGDVQTFTASQPPVFAGLTAATAWQTPVDIPLRKLLAKASDPEGGTVTLTAAGPASAHGGTVVLLADAIRYTPPNNFSGADTFTVVLADAGGASVTGTVMVAVGQGPNAGDIGGNPPALTVLPDGKVGISCQGIPGRTYTVQRSIGGLNDWETLASATADASGKVSFIDDNPPPGSAFYRLWVP
jgi:hypothetical protein